MICCECNTWGAHGVLHLGPCPKERKLGSAECTIIYARSIAILGAGRPDEVIMTENQFTAFRVASFVVMHTALGDETANTERFVKAVAGTSDEKLMYALQRHPAKTLALVRAWLQTSDRKKVIV